MTDEEKIILENQKLIYFVLKKMNLFEQSEELFDLGMIGLVKGAKTYNSSKGSPSTYLYICIRSEIQTYIRKKRHNTISLSTELGEDFTLEDVIPDSYKFESVVELNDYLKNLLNNLSERERKYIIEYYGLFGVERKNTVEMAKKLHISNEAVAAVIRRAMNKLRMAMIKENEWKRII